MNTKPCVEVSSFEEMASSHNKNTIEIQNSNIKVTIRPNDLLSTIFDKLHKKEYRIMTNIVTYNGEQT